MSETKEREPLSGPMAMALNRLSAEGSASFDLADFAAALGCDRVRACSRLFQLRKDGWVASIAMGRYLIVPSPAIEP